MAKSPAATSPSSTGQTSSPSGGQTGSPSGDQTGPPSGDLSSGAKAGIGVGVAIFVLSALATGIWWYRSRKNQRAVGARGRLYGDKPELHGQSADPASGRQEIDGNAIGEMEGSGFRETAELGRRQRDGDLDGHGAHLNSGNTQARSWNELE